MKRILDEHLGRLLLLIALVWSGLAMALFPERPASLPGVESVKYYREQVGVAYVPGELAPAERVFPERRAEEYRRAQRAVFAPEPPKPPPPPPTDLPLPTRASIRRPPQLLPDPGPSLEGADALPRWNGDGDPLLKRQRRAR